MSRLISCRVQCVSLSIVKERVKFRDCSFWVKFIGVGFRFVKVSFSFLYPPVFYCHLIDSKHEVDFYLRSIDSPFAMLCRKKLINIPKSFYFNTKFKKFIENSHPIEFVIVDAQVECSLMIFS